MSLKNTDEDPLFKKKKGFNSGEQSFLTIRQNNLQ